jgi:hypothetical protein
MASGSSSTTIDTKQFELKMAAADVKIRTQVALGLNKIGTLAASQLRATMPRDTSYMATHVEVVHATPETLVEVITSDANYTLAQDQGAKPHMPPSDALEAWGTRHGFPKGSGFIIARAIAKRGLPARNFIKPVADAGKAQAIPILEAAVKDIW